MNDKNQDQQDENEFKDDFQDDFEFEEEQFVEQPTTSASGGSPLQAKPKVFLLFGLVIAVIVGYLIWYIFSKSSTPSTPSVGGESVLLAGSNAGPQTTATNGSQAPSTAPNTVPPVLPPGGMPKTPQPQAQTQPSGQPVPPTGEENLFSESELQAFQAFTEQSPVQPSQPAAPGQPAANGKLPGPGQPATNGKLPGPEQPVLNGKPVVNGQPAAPGQPVAVIPVKPETGPTPTIVSPPPPPPASETLPTPGAMPQETTIQQLQQELFTPEKPMPAKPMPEKQVIVPSPPPLPLQEIQPAVTIKETPPPITGSELQQFQQAVTAVTKLNQQMENNLNQIKYLDAYTREISQTVNKLNSQISAMDNRILALSNTATTLSKDVGTVKTEVGTVRRVIGEETCGVVGPVEIMPAAPLARKQRVEVPLIEELEYTVHAVIPGRAWLKSSKGHIITVTEGDSIGNYGKVLVIDASNSVVLTNSGVTFR